jgi:hypothetical protein
LLAADFVGDPRSLMMPTTKDELATGRRAPLSTPSELGTEATKNITGALDALLADVFALYLKTKNFHWHVSGPHFADVCRLPWPFDTGTAQPFGALRVLPRKPNGAARSRRRQEDLFFGFKRGMARPPRGENILNL